MNRISYELLKIAKQLQSVPTDTYQHFQNYSDDYQKKYGEKPDPKLWDLFDTQEQVDQFLKNKSKQFPHLKEIIGVDTIKRLLNEDWFVIVSAGRNRKQVKFNNISEQQLKQRYEQLRNFLQSLNLPYYEVIGQYQHSSELSYIVDLSNAGKNSEENVKSNLRKIRQFCGDSLKQDSIIEGLGRQRVYMYTSGNKKSTYHKKIGQLPAKNDIGRSQLFTDKNDRTNNETWADNYDFSTTHKDGWV